MTRAGDRPPGARSFGAADEQEWDELLDEFNALVAAQYGTKKIELEHSMSRKEPQTPADIAAEMIVAAGQQPINDLYQQRTYQVLLGRGQPPAEALRNAQFWARLKVADPQHVFGPADDFMDPLAALGDAAASITADPDTGIRTYNPGYQPYAAATSFASAGGPPVVLEYSRNQWLGMSQPINRFALNPGGDYYAGISGTPPTMFGAGDLPVLTGSGVDPSMLRWVSWQLTPHRGLLLLTLEVAQLIELSLEGDPEGWYTLTSEAGRDALNGYWAKIANWVNTPEAEGGPEVTEEEIARFYPPESD